MSARPPVVDQQAWRAALDDLRAREKAATRELDAIAAQRRRLPMLELPQYVLIGADGPVSLASQWAVTDNARHPAVAAQL